MKKSILLIGLLFLAGCDVFKPEKPSCEWETNQTLRAQLFDKCLARAADARKGKSYTTNDDEDYDEVIKACDDATYGMSRFCVKKENKE